MEPMSTWRLSARSRVVMVCDRRVAVHMKMPTAKPNSSRMPTNENAMRLRMVITTLPQWVTGLPGQLPIDFDDLEAWRDGFGVYESDASGHGCEDLIRHI